MQTNSLLALLSLDRLRGIAADLAAMPNTNPEVSETLNAVQRAIAAKRDEAATAAHVEALRKAVREMPNNAFGLLSDRYFRVADALPGLATMLENLDCETTDAGAGPFLEEHFVIAEMVELLKRSKLGAAL